MSYTYGMQGAPTVGGGLGGLPSRSYIGQIAQFFVTPSNDWLPCNGAVYLKSAYPELAQKLPLSYYGASTETYTPISDTLVDMACGENSGESAFSLTLNSNFTYVFYVQGGRITSANYILSAQSFPATLRYLGGGKWFAMSRGFSASSYISYDNARTWTANTAATTSVRSVCGDELGNIYIACNNGSSSFLQKSTNNGVSWTTKATLGAAQLPSQDCLCYVGNGVLFFLYVNGFMRVSYDYGETWSAYTSPTLLSNGTQTAVYSNSKGVMFARAQIAIGSGDSMLVASYNNGATWVSTPFNSRVGSELNVVCSYRSDTWTVTTAGLGAFISADNGKSFNSVGIRDDLASNLKYCATTNEASYSYTTSSSGTGRISYLGNSFSVPSISGTNQYIKAR